MTFACQYRTRTGAPATELVEAADRADALAKLRARGVSPISVREATAADREQAVRQNAGARPPSAKRGLWAGLIVVAIACGVAWHFGGKMGETPEPRAAEEPPAEKKTPPKRVVPDKPVLVTNAVRKAAETPPPAPPPAAEAKPAEPPKKVRLTITGRPVRMITNRVARVKGKYEIFKARSDNHISTYLTAPFGTMFVGDLKYDESFLEDFKKSLEEPIEIDPDDSAEIREVKERVAAAKAELKKMYENGEDVCAVFRQTREELQKLGRYKATLESQLREIQSDKTMTDQDVADFVAAANKMLEEKGIAPIEVSGFTREVLKDSAGIREDGEDE